VFSRGDAWILSKLGSRGEDEGSDEEEPARQCLSFFLEKKKEAKKNRFGEE